MGDFVPCPECPPLSVEFEHLQQELTAACERIAELEAELARVENRAPTWAEMDNTLAENERLEKRIAALEAALSDALVLADDGWGYASDYFRYRHNYKGEALRLATIAQRKEARDG